MSIQRWPLRAREEMLHTRRVPLLAEFLCQDHVYVVNNAPQRPPSCAGVGEPDGVVLVCWDCLNSLIQKKTHMPREALANDNCSGGK